MKTITLQQFGKKYFKHLKEAPLIITANRKNRWVIFDYSTELMEKIYPIQGLEYKGVPIMPDISNTTSSDWLYALNTNDIHKDINRHVKKLSLLQRIKLILYRKVL